MYIVSSLMIINVTLLNTNKVHAII